MSPRKWTRTGWACLLLSGALCAVMSVCYAGRPDGAAAFTLWPPWVWMLPGLLLLALGMRAANRRPLLLGVVLWVGFLAWHEEEPRSVLRGCFPESRAAWEAARAKGRALRVVSLNCGGGIREAAEEVVPLHPDVVLLQESPGDAAVRALAARLYGPAAGVVSGPDAAILARGPILSAARQPRTAFYVRGRVRVGELEAEVVSLRLTPPVVRMDLWAPDCWREQAENRRFRREQLREIVEELAGLPEGVPVIAGGDFNAPAGDAVFRLLRPRLRDGFSFGGRGWANTALNDIPVARIDQVWSSPSLRAVRLVARRTVYSDHRMVVCDLLRL